MKSPLPGRIPLIFLAVMLCLLPIALSACQVETIPAPTETEVLSTDLPEPTQR